MQGLGVLVGHAGELLNAGAALLYPENCQLCGSHATAAESFVCGGCRKSVRFIERPYCERCGRPYEGDITNEFECATCLEAHWDFLSARSAVLARGPARDVILRYKYNRAFWFEPFLADLLIQRAQAELAKSKWDLIVPVPLHPTKERSREFNQAERLAKFLGRACGLPVKTRLLRRVLATRTQTRLPRKERLENVKNAFAIRGKQRLNGERVVVVDDVFTTGATTSACAKVIKAAGAAEVCVWTVARGV